MALTATATSEVRADIARQLGMVEPKITITGRYDYAHAAAVIRASIEDYLENFTPRP